MSNWFRPKRYGYGATPANWKGWAAMAVFSGAMAALGFLLLPAHGEPGLARLLVFDGALVSAVFLFIWIARKKTDGAWRWRWGSRD